MKRLLILTATAILALSSGCFVFEPGDELQCEGPTVAKPWQDWIDAGCFPVAAR